MVLKILKTCSNHSSLGLSDAEDTIVHYPHEGGIEEIEIMPEPN